jgi:hypothetical protein
VLLLGQLLKVRFPSLMGNFTRDERAEQGHSKRLPGRIVSMHKVLVADGKGLKL